MICCTLVCFFATSVHAQVGIYNDAPDPSSTLDIQSTTKGLLIPRMNTAQKLTIPVSTSRNGLLVYDTDLNCISIYMRLRTGAYGWTCLTPSERGFFYMPSINIPVRNAAGDLLVGNQQLNLFVAYTNQFNIPAYRSTGAPATSIPRYSASQLYYYVTYHDPSITVTNISSVGVMNYTVNSGPNYDSFVNIVFVVK